MKKFTENEILNNFNIDSSILLDIEDLIKNKDKIIISQDTSAVFWGFSNAMNQKITLTVPKGYNPRIKNNLIKIKQRSPKKFQEGICSFEMNDQIFYIYSPERTIVELIKEKVDSLNYFYVETFKNFFQNFKYDADEIKKMSKLFNVEKETMLIKVMASHR